MQFKGLRMYNEHIRQLTNKLSLEVMLSSAVSCSHTLISVTDTHAHVNDVHSNGLQLTVTVQAVTIYAITHTYL
jgi:hypothetical protein